MTRPAIIGAVVIGRNEGGRLIRCLESLRESFARLVYVDSGSSDGSVAAARALGVQVISLDCDIPFTAARARNAGFATLLTFLPEIDFVQFVDGDCEIVAGWVERGATFLRDHPTAAVAFGHLRERFPAASVYNRICSIEWDTPLGDVDSSGGIVMIRAAPFLIAQGFREDLIAGEEPELCYRLRRARWTVRKLDVEMAIHDAAMTKASQWWERNRRSGYSIAQADADRGQDVPELQRQVLSNLIWSLPPAWLLWPILWWRIRRSYGAAYAAHIVLGKIPHAQGQLTYWRDRFLNKRAKIIEYK